MNEFRVNQLVVFQIPKGLESLIDPRYNLPKNGEVVKIESFSEEFKNAVYLSGYTRSHNGVLQSIEVGFLRPLYSRDADFICKNIIDKVRKEKLVK